MLPNSWSGRWHGKTPTGDQHCRARKVITPSGGIMRGKFPSRKNGRMVHHEGLLELDAIYLFETSPRVVRYREQIPTIHYADGARLRRYTPDFELVLDSGEIITVEVKSAWSLEREDVAHKIECIQDYYRRREQPYVVLTEEALREEPRQSNLRWIFHQMPRIPPTSDAIRLAVSLNQHMLPTSISQAVDLLSSRSVDPFSALTSGYLTCRLDAPVSLATPVEHSKEDGHAWFLVAPKFGF